MLDRRPIAVSPDAAFRERLATAFQASAGGVEVHATAEALASRAPQGALCVIHFEADLMAAANEILARLSAECRVIAVLPRSNLAAIVELMQMSTLVVGMIVAEDLDDTQLTAMATRVITGDIFGLEKMLPAGTPIQSQLVGDNYEKSRCMSQVSGFATRSGAPARYDEPIEQCLDEMLMNALYDAPVDDQGKAVFAEIPPRTRITLRVEQKVLVQYACDGQRFAVSVRDGFGTLERQTFLRILQKCLHAEDKVDRKVGGAGLGLYLMLNAASSVLFNMVPGVATEAVCMFDLQAPKRQLAQFGFCSEPRDVTGKLVPAPRPAAGVLLRAVRPGARRRKLLAVAAAAVIVVAIAALPRILRGRERPLPATVELDSTPSGATVEIDGVPMGGTPLKVTSLTPETTVSIVFKEPGYVAATARLQVPEAGKVERLVQPLVLSDQFVRVHFVSQPPGAQILRDDKPVALGHTYTPADVFVEANVVQRFTLTMRKHAPLVIEPFTPLRGSAPIEKGGTLELNAAPP